MAEPSLARVIALASEFSGMRGLHAASAVDQDMRISGEDVSEFAEALAADFGSQVMDWPWGRFANLMEDLPLLFPLTFVRQLLTWPSRGSFEYPNSLERLELGHIAAVIDVGHWFEP